MYYKRMLKMVTLADYRTYTTLIWRYSLRRLAAYRDDLSEHLYGKQRVCLIIILLTSSRHANLIKWAYICI